MNKARIAVLASALLIGGQIVITPKPGNSGTTIINNTFNEITNTSGNFISEGCQVVWLTGYQYQVSACNYSIENVQYSTTASQTVTLDAPDGSNPRLDVIVINTSLTVTFVKGTAAATPSEPSVDPGSQLKLALVLVTNGTTEPVGVSNTRLYDDNAGGPTEWNCTTSGSGFNCDSTNNPKSPSTKDIEGTNPTNGSYAQLQIPASTFDPSTAQTLVMFIRSKAQWANNRGLQVGLFSAGVLRGVQIQINRSGTWGFNSSNTTDYQQVAIPLSNFQVPVGSTITQVRIADFGGAIGFYLDDIYFQLNAQVIPVGDFVKGPSSATDNAIARYDATTGKLIQNSGVTIDDTGNIVSSAGIYFGANHPNGVQAGALGSIYHRTNGFVYTKLGGAATAYGWYPTNSNFVHVSGMYANVLGTSAATFGWLNTPAGTLTGTMASGSADQDDVYNLLSTAGTTNSEAELITSGLNTVTGVSFDAVFVVKLAQTTLQRFWVGMINGANYANADDQAFAQVAFRYSTVAGDAGMVPITDDGTTQTVGTSLGAIGTSKMTLRIRTVGPANGPATSVAFSLNDGTEQVITTNIPPGPSGFRFAVSITTLENAIKSFRLSRAFAYSAVTIN